jgi:hypothetical protein
MGSFTVKAENKMTRQRMHPDISRADGMIGLNWSVPNGIASRDH